MVETRRSGAAENRRRPPQAVTASPCHWGGTILVLSQHPPPTHIAPPSPAPLRHHRRHHPGSEPEPLSIPCCWWLPMPGFSVVSLSCQARITQSIKLVCESSWARLIPRIDTDASHSGMASFKHKLPLCHASISPSTDACNGRLSIIPFL